MTMGAVPGFSFAGSFAMASGCGLIVSALATWIALVYARRHGLLDQPGKRRSHSSPTPRGGGVGIVASMLLVALPAWGLLDDGGRWTQPVALAAAVLAVALVGWRDDHAALPVAPRLLVHAAAAVLVAAVVLAQPAGHDPRLWWLLLPVAPVLVGCINVHNFMDGIDGLLGQQGLFVMLGYALLATWAGHMGIAGLGFAVAAGCLGFLAFNAPPAKIFMGDVGSGALGLLIGAVGALLVQRNPAMLWPCLILSSTFLADGGLTLARRVVGRQRWYAPHRQHLYQWLVRVKWSHARTDVAYMTWNLAIVAPLAWIAARWPAYGVWGAVAAYLATGMVWYIGKRACLSSVQRSASREVA